MSSQIKNNRQAGFTLLELLLVVGVGALLLIGGIATYRLVTEGNKVTESTRLLLQIKQEAQSLFSNQATYNGLTEQMLMDLGTIPQSQNHPFNGLVTVGDNGATFTVTFAAIPGSACVKLGRAITDPDDVVNLSVAGGGVDSATLISDLVNGCGAGPTDMIWEFN